MFNSKKLAQAVALALLVPGAALAEFEISGTAKLEHQVFTSDGRVTGAPAAHDAGDAMKTEGSLKLFINSDVGEESAFHAELLLADDGEAASSRLEGGEEYTQYDVLREFYFDVPAGGWDFRIGKQQVVWGTADGIKLLDIINPTDFRELNQNVMEDARIPVWMLNAEKYFDDGSSIQFILSEAQPNFIAGLDAGGDSGAPFIFKGVDTITGKTHGFYNIGKDMGKTAGVFQTLLTMGGLGGANGASALAAGPMSLFTVGGFTALGTGAPNQTFPQVGQSLTAAPTIDLNGDGNPDAVSQDALGNGSGLIQFPSPTLTSANPANATNSSLLNVIFLPFMSQLGTGNVVLNQAANTSGNLIQNFGGYVAQLQAGLKTQTANGAPFTNSASSVLDVTGDGLADTTIVNNAVQELGRQMTLSVANAFGINFPKPGNLQDQDNQAAFGALANALGVAPPTGNQANPADIAFNDAVQNAAFAGMQSSFFSNSSTNQFDGTLSPNAPTSTFDFMGNTTFGTFESFIGMRTQYRRDYDTDPFSEGNLGFRYRNATEGGMNYSLNYAYRMDSNPYVEIHWEDRNGNRLNSVKRNTDIDALGQPLDFDGNGTIDNPNPKAATVTTVSLQYAEGPLAGTKFDSSGGNPLAWGSNPATLVFEEKLNRINTLGASFDAAVDSLSVPMVLRGEFSYDVETKQPVINLNELAVGNITEALKMEDADMFKYVFGVDITVMTNLLISTQLIQFFNLDYIDSGVDANGVACGANRSCGRYTGDFSSMHLTNGLKKGDEVESFISLFLSKPFGPDVQHRWNNILIAENDGGYWNRFDVEYSFNNELVGTFEWNRYWGDEDTMFGQFENSSNVQLGVKYLF